MITSLFTYVRNFQLRLNIIPFEAAFSLFAIYSGLVSLIEYGVVANIVREVTGRLWTTIFDVVFIFSGLAIYFGIGLSRRDFEAVGLIMMVASIIVRVMLIMNSIGFIPITINNYVFNIIFLITCCIRLNSVLRRHIIIRLDDSPEKLLHHDKSFSVIRH